MRDHFTKKIYSIIFTSEETNHMLSKQLTDVTNEKGPEITGSQHARRIAVHIFAAFG